MVGLRLSSSGFEPLELVLDRFRQGLEDAEPAFQEIAEYQKTVVNARTFANQGPLGTGRWPALSPDYARWKAKVRPGRPILVFNGDLRDSMISMSKGITEVTHRSAIVGTADPKAIFHQRGTGRMPARPILGPQSDKDSRHMAKILQRFVIQGGT